jgi:hypothetical protein
VKYNSDVKINPSAGSITAKKFIVSGGKNTHVLLANGDTTKIEDLQIDTSNFVTLDGTQTISGTKTFSSSTTFSDSISVTNNVTVGGKLKKGTLEFTLPSKSGTIALTTDVPNVDHSRI